MLPHKTRVRTVASLSILTTATALIFSNLGVTPVRAAGILYATPGGTGNCSTWVNACNLQAALAMATSGDEVWVAAGTYKPTSETDRAATLQIRNGLAIYGGFAGVETTREQRNWSVNETILSGDIGATGDTSDNSFHVVTAFVTDNTTILDGFTIQNGNANGAGDPDNNGGGLYASYASPTLVNLIFSGNSASQFGGGVYCQYGSPIFNHVIFSNNSSSVRGGGIDILEGSPRLFDVVVSGNTSDVGGGLAILRSTAILAEITFYHNSTSSYGGGMYNDNSTSSMTNVTFTENHSSWGGGLNNHSSNPLLTNITFTGNTADYGAGMVSWENSHPVLTNVTIASNPANFYGGGIYTVNGSLQIRNSVLWGNTASFDGSQVYAADANIPELNYSVVQNGCPTGSTCASIFTSDPLLGTLANNGGLTQTIPLLAGSPAIDTGNDSLSPSTDQRGITRPQGVHSDIGAFEVVNLPPTISFSDTTASLPEDTSTASAIPIADIIITDDGIGTNSLSLSGTDAAMFEIVASILRLRAGSSLNYETKPNLHVIVAVDDSTISGGPEDTEEFILAITNVNEAPTDISLSVSSIAENAPADTVVGSLSTTDPDSGNSFTYSLVSGTGSTDNASFNISGSSLRTSTSFNFETKSTYLIRIRSTDQGGLFYEETFTITVTNVNEAPTDIALSASSLNENAPANTVVGTLSSTDPDTGNTFTYTLVSGTGSTDNASFNISGSSLRTSAVFDFEVKSSYSIRLRSTDQGGLPYEEAFTITVSNVNEAPTDISLSASSVNENAPANTIVGALSTTDQDAGNTFTYTFVSGTGDTDNASFNISGSNLRASASFNYEAKSSYSIRVRSTDQGGLFYEEAFIITVTNVNEAPTDIALSAYSIGENAPANTSVGTLSTSDPDNVNTFTYSLAAGTGGTDNASFNISGSSLRTSAAFDYEGKNSYSIRVRSTDQGGLFYEEAFTITVNNVNETPTDISLSASSVAENAAINTTVGSLSSTDPDSSNTFTYTLVSGAGSADNAFFNISGSSLRTSASFDVETKSTYSLRVRSTDQGGLYYEEAFTITVTNVNEDPTITSNGGGSSTNLSVAENSTAVTTVTATDPDAGATLVFSISGGADAARFTINSTSGALAFASAPNYESPTDAGTNNVYDVIVQVSDGFLTDTQAIAVTITNANEAPTDIALSASSVNENLPTNTIVGSLSTSDPDSSNTFTYTLVTGTGDTDNASFNLSGNSLRALAVFNFETKSSYSIRISSTDQEGLFYEEAFVITIIDVNEAPTDISLSVSSIAENAPADTVVGSLSTTDPDSGNTFTYSLVSGTGSTDNTSFNISGNNLRTSAVFDFETKSTYSIRIRSTDQGGQYYEEVFTITVTNVNEAPILLLDNSLSSIAENTNTSSRIKVADIVIQDDALGTNILSLSGADSAFFEIDGNALYLQAGSILDYETNPILDVNVSVDDAALGSVPEDSEALAISVTDINEPPAVVLSNTVASLAENTDTSTRVRVADISVLDDNLGTNLLALSGGDAALFEIGGNALYLKAETVLDFELKPGLNVSVTVDDASVGATPDDTASLAITVTNVNEAPAITSNGGGATASISMAENATPVTTVTATDPDASTTLAYSISGGADAARFTINPSSGALAFSSAPNFEAPSDAGANNVYDVTVQVSDGSLTDTQTIAITITNANETPTDISLSPSSIAENAAANTVVGALSTSDPDSGNTFTYSLVTGTGDTDNASFNISGNSLRALAVFNFETKSSYSVRLRSTDQGGLFTEKAFNITITNVNETPTIDLANTTTSLSENANTTSRIKVADIVITDDSLGTNAITLTGTDAAMFEVIGNELFLKAGTSLDFETYPVLTVIVAVDDTEAGATPDDTVTLVINLIDGIDYHLVYLPFITR